ncbi:hypothetical protein F5Y19DRAFT_278079 [Xylariaceae sp. FL1651]|nr:hypothetical protein F5Y19DRAFT_278079 [Xylariaceae sp. FL1651]
MSESPQTDRPGPGGFIPPSTSLPSPAPSTASSRVAALLPHPRSKPLVPGSRKEDYARDYVARRLLHISRRYVKKHGIPDPADEVSGYESMDEVCRDLEEVVDVLWFSGTPSLQVPYLLNVALAFNTYLPSFPPSPRPTFALLKKLDHCFASLLVGHDVKTKKPLPGFSSAVDNSARQRFSRTDMVRCKSLADETRMLVAVVMSGELDVVDYSDDEVVSSRPARAKTERSDYHEATSSTLHGFQGVETVKAEDMEGFSDLEIDDDDEKIASLKRKAEETAESGGEAEESTESKRVKVEDDTESGVGLNGIAPADASSNPIATTTATTDSGSKGSYKGQFHWALDEDDDSDDEDDPNTSNTPTTTSRARSSNTLSVAPPISPSPIPNADGDEGDEIGGDEENAEEGEEDEELQLNVGKVYDKTLVQLGQSLGESIIDD